MADADQHETDQQAPGARAAGPPAAGEPARQPDPETADETREIDELACRAKGVQRRAEVAAESLVQLEAFKVQYGTARSDYEHARAQARPDVVAAWTQVEVIEEQLRCHLGEELRERLEIALGRVERRIDACSAATAAAMEEPDDDAEFGPGDENSLPREIARLAGLIERYRRLTQKAAARFTALVGEQTGLPTEAGAIRAELDKLEGEVGADARHADVVRLWARWLIARYRLRALYRDFPTVTEYAEQVREALARTLRGWQIVARLEGRKARLECEENAREEACAELRSDTLGAVLAEYEWNWPAQHSGDAVEV